MDPALRAAATGMMAQQTRTEVISNNLANVNTPGFKRSRAHFEDLLYQSIQGQQVLGDPNADTAPAIQVGRGTRLAGIMRMHDQGTVEVTGRNLDMMIEGNGFFQLDDGRGNTSYTRDGSFQISDKGLLTTSDGWALQPPVRIPTDAVEISISTNGIVSVRRGRDIAPTEIAKLDLVAFANPSGLQSLGRNMYAPTAASGEPVIGAPGDAGMGTLQQGSLEGSNVEIVQEMVEMITAMRAYEINSKAIKNADEMGQMANNLTR